MNMMHRTDCYKIGHIYQYPEGTEQVFSNWTARKSRVEGIDKVIFFGLQGYIQKTFINYWKKNFFDRPIEEVENKYLRRMNNMGLNVQSTHVRALHNLGYLPLEIWALPEGSRVPIGVASFVIFNTLPEFFWLTNFVETDMSANLWQASTNATIANRYRQILLTAAEISGGAKEFVDWQGHDFSYRGMAGTEAAAISGAAHLLSFNGTDTIPAIDYLEEYYGADSDNEIIGGSVPATEHSVMCMGGQETEIETFKRLLKLYPKGILSVVSDTWDYWKVLTEIIPQLKNEIMEREGTLVVRPDSGDPELILCGNPLSDDEAIRKGSFQILWDIFGGTMNNKGFRQLDPHIGVIYGDSITKDWCANICMNLISQKFVPSMVLGIGSYTYQMVTRDTFGHALKSTAGIVNGENKEIFKDPVTDSGEKKSAKGYVAVYEENGSFVQKDRVSLEETKNCAYNLVFRNGQLKTFHSLQDIRNRIR